MAQMCLCNLQYHRAQRRQGQPVRHLMAQRAKSRLAEVEAKVNNQPAPAPTPGAEQPAKKKRFLFF